MRLGEYLVEVGIATEEEIIAALAAQHHRQAYLPMLAVERGVLSAADAFALLNSASAQGKSFLEAAREQGVLSTDAISKLTAAQREGVPPLGQILVDMGVLVPEELEAHIADLAKCRSNPSGARNGQRSRV